MQDIRDRLGSKEQLINVAASKGASKSGKKRFSNRSLSRVVKGTLKQTAVIREERWTSLVASSLMKIYQLDVL
jgi:hypothetical protein